MTTPVEPQSRPPLDNPQAQEAAHTKELAKDLAQAIADRGKTLRNQGQQPEKSVRQEPVQEEGMTELEQSMLQGGEVPTDQQLLEEQPLEQEQEETFFEDEEVFTPEQVTALEQALSAAGVNITVPISEIPEEVRPQYVDALEQALNIVQDAQERELAASEQSMAVQEFGQKLQSAPDKVLLALAMSHPKVFSEVAAIMEEASQDPRLRNLILRELQVEARQQDSLRREQVLAQRDVMAKARVVITATKRAAQRYNVPFKTADKVVSLAVQANGGDLDPAVVDEIVKDLQVPGAQRHRKVVLAEQRAQRAQKTQPAVNPKVTPSASPKASPGLDVSNNKREGGGGMFRQLVGDAVRRFSSSSQER